MPIHPYKCNQGHITDLFFKTFAAAELNKDTEFKCELCGEPTERILGVPLEAHLYGNPDGYAKPSPTKRYNTKTVSQRDGNKHSAG